MRSRDIDRYVAIMLRYGKLDEDACVRARVAAARTGRPLLDILKESGAVSVFDLVFARLEATASALSSVSGVARAFRRLPTRC